MRRFDYSFLKEKPWDNEIVGYLSQIHELKGKQMLYLRQKPAMLRNWLKLQRFRVQNPPTRLRESARRIRACGSS